MMSVLQMVVGAAAIAGLFGVWVAVQALQRRTTPGMTDDTDVLECRMCGPNGECGCGLKRALAARRTER